MLDVKATAPNCCTQKLAKLTRAGRGRQTRTVQEHRRQLPYQCTTADLWAELSAGKAHKHNTVYIHIHTHTHNKQLCSQDNCGL